MKLHLIASLLLSLAGSAYGQNVVTTADGSVPADLAPIGPPAVLPATTDSTSNLVDDLPMQDFIAAQARVTEAFDDPEVARLTAEIERLIDQRDDLLFTVAARKHPEKAKHFKKMNDHIKERKGKQKKRS